MARGRTANTEGITFTGGKTMFHTTQPRTLFVLGGFAAAVILLVFGAVSMVVGYQGRAEVRNSLAAENIIGPADSTIPGQLVDTGSEAKAQADIIRVHQMNASGGLTYSEMGRFATPDGNPAGTNDAELAAKDANGNPVPNAARNQWVTATALSTALNTAYFAEQVGLFSMVMGAALMLTGAGFAVLTAGALRRPAEATETAPGAPKGATLGTVS